jgi:hypothetical protein
MTSSTHEALAMEASAKGGGWGGRQQDEGGRWVGRKKGVSGLGFRFRFGGYAGILKKKLGVRGGPNKK